MNDKKLEKDSSGGFLSVDREQALKNNWQQIKNMKRPATVSNNSNKTFFPKIFTSLDLELNQNSSGAKIIQIGAVVGNLETGEILERLSVFINPHEILEPFIIQLTKITQEQVDNGVTLEEAYNLLKSIHKKHNSFVNFVQWGCGDSQALLEQLKKENPNFEGWCGGRRDIDVKTLYISWRLANGKAPNGGLKKAMNNLNLKFEGKPHDALADSLNTFTVFRTMIKKYSSQ